MLNIERLKKLEDLKKEGTIAETEMTELHDISAEYFAELSDKKPLSGSEKAWMRVYEKSLKAKSAKSRNNVFGKKPTTDNPVFTIRFSDKERAGLSELINDIKANNEQLIKDELFSDKEISNAKIIRAAILLLKKKSHKQIIKAIKEVKKDMIR